MRWVKIVKNLKKKKINKKNFPIKKDKKTLIELKKKLRKKESKLKRPKN